jgi:DNA-binding helix-hairpin-helix protein with protein kinase domain
MINVGSDVQLMHARTAGTVARLVGEGAQGRVFAIAIDTADGSREYALKWYRNGFATPAQRWNLESLVERGTPGRNFLWPIDLVEAAGDDSFGYLMQLRPSTYVPIADLLNGRVDPPITVLADLGMSIAESFLLLHGAGLCYRDINLGNVFFDATTGQALVCDLDNVGVDGQGTAEIAGSPFFSAPEVVRGEVLPSIATDRFSLAVLLFLLLMLHHPLEGARALKFDVLDDEAERQLFGADPVFVFDPDDVSNRPVAGIHDNALLFWPRFPPFLRRLFTISFTEGLADPGARVTEGEWRRAMRRLRDATLTCPSCQADVFFNEESGRADCWSCGVEITVPARLEVDGGSSVFLTPGAIVTAHHVERAFDFTAVGEVIPHPTDASILGLRNLTTGNWQVRLGDTEATTIPPGRSIAIIDGLQIRFASLREGHVVTGPASRPSS